VHSHFLAAALLLQIPTNGLRLSIGDCLNANVYFPHVAKYQTCANSDMSPANGRTVSGISKANACPFWIPVHVLDKKGVSIAIVKFQITIVHNL